MRKPLLGRRRASCDGGFGLENRRFRVRMLILGGFGRATCSGPGRKSGVLRIFNNKIDK